MKKTDLEDLMRQTQKIQENMQKAKEDLVKVEVEGKAGAGLVCVVMTGRYDVKRVAIDESVMSENKSLLEDLLAAAVNDAVRKVEENNKGKMSSLTEGLNLLGDFKMPF